MGHDMYLRHQGREIGYLGIGAGSNEKLRVYCDVYAVLGQTPADAGVSGDGTTVVVDERIRSAAANEYGRLSQLKEGAWSDWYADAKRRELTKFFLAVSKCPRETTLKFG